MVPDDNESYQVDGQHNRVRKSNKDMHTIIKELVPNNLSSDNENNNFKEKTKDKKSKNNILKYNNILIPDDNEFYEAGNEKHIYNQSTLQKRLI